MTTREVLGAAKARIDKPQKWCRGGGSCRERASNKRVCAYLALNECGDSSTDMISALRKLDAPGGLILFNDTHSHPEVMALFDRAIEAQS